MNTVILAVFIASTSFFEAALPVGTGYQQKQFPNSDEGLRQFQRWVDESGVAEFDHVCVSGPSIETTPVLSYWSRRSKLVFFMRYADVQDYAQKQSLPQVSASAIAAACADLAARK